MIQLYSDAGLCNRMRVIDSTLILAETLQQNIRMYWPLNRACGVPFSHLFNPIQCLEFVEKPFGEAEKLWNRSTQSTRFKFQRLLGKACLLEGNIRDACAKLLNSRERNVRLFIRTDHAFQYPERYSAFIPVNRLIHRIDECTAKFDPNTIGVHIRRGDHKQAIQQSPLEGFALQIERQLLETPNVRFFACTDCPSTRASLKSRFGDAIINFDHKLSRTDEDGVENAVVELWSLSRCTEVWGSFGSSFSTAAFHLSQKKLKLRWVRGMQLVDN